MRVNTGNNLSDEGKINNNNTSGHVTRTTGSAALGAATTAAWLLGRGSSDPVRVGVSGVTNLVPDPTAPTHHHQPAHGRPLIPTPSTLSDSLFGQLGSRNNGVDTPIQVLQDSSSASAPPTSRPVIMPSNGSMRNSSATADPVSALVNCNTMSQNTTSSSSPGLLSSPQQSTPAAMSNGYNTNGIFLVDGLGRGVRVETNPQRASMLNEYGLPPVPPNFHIRMGSADSRLESNTSANLGVFSGSTPIAGVHHKNHRTSPSAAVPATATSPPKCKLNSLKLPVPSPPFPSTAASLAGLATEPSPAGNPRSFMSTGVAAGPSPTAAAIPFASTSSPGALTPANKPSGVGISPSRISSPVTVVPTSVVPDILRLGHPDSGSSSSSAPAAITPQRTLISTEAQTEDLPTIPPPSPRNREQRKRERRRERRRDHRRGHGSPPATTSRGIPTTSGGVIEGALVPGGRSSMVEALPPGAVAELLHQHQHPPPPPPYSTLPPPPPAGERRAMVPLPVLAHPIHHPVPGPQQQVMVAAGAPSPMLQPPTPNCPGLLGLQPSCVSPPPIRYHFSVPAPPVITRASRRSLRTPRDHGIPYHSEEEPKSCCCGMTNSQAISTRWFILVIALIGICCTVAGTALGAAKSAHGTQHLTLSLIMIGLGIILLTVSAVAWRLTSSDSSSGTSCRAMLGFSRNGGSCRSGDGGSEPNRVFLPRLAPSYGRPHHPYAAMMYPDFQYRPPPPSYQASMQEYRLRLLLLERSNPTIAAAAAAIPNSAAHSIAQPPPAYRPYRTAPHFRNDGDYSRPPSYRSRSGGGSGQDGSSVMSRDPSGHMSFTPHHASPLHSRDPSILSYLSQHSLCDNVSVVSGNVPSQGNSNSAVVTVMQAVSVGMDLGLSISQHLVGYGSPTDGDTGTGTGPDTPELNKDFPHAMVQEGDQLVVDEKRKEPPEKDGNLVRIVQTTDSSHVIGRDSSTVIVTVSSGSNHNNSLWNQATAQLNQNLANNVNSQVVAVASAGTNQIHPPHSPENNNEVQILAHL